MTYKLWKAIYTYETPGEQPVNKAKEIYHLIGKNAKEAEQKADRLFAYSSFHKKVLEHGEVKKTIKEYEKGIPIPCIDYKDDRGKFTITPKVKKTDKGYTLEFIVKENERGAC